MTKKHTIELPDFNIRIEQAIVEHIAACRAAAIATVELAFAANLRSSAKTRRSRRAGEPPLNAPQAPRLVESPARRTPAEMAAVMDRLYEAICAKPGECKAVLAAEVGLSAHELDRPMNHLKSAGKVRRIGERHLSRYFPLASEVVDP